MTKSSASRTTAPALSIEAGRAPLMARFRALRRRSEDLTAGLTPEDQVVQSMEDASPTKWHLAHTSWFFEEFILTKFDPGYRAFDTDYFFLFNSYYEGAGPRHARPRRGLLTRPSVAEVARYRDHVTAAVETLAAETSPADWQAIASLIELGIHHEQQHQELLLTDLLHAFSCNPLKPAYRPYRPAAVGKATELEWAHFDGGVHEIGHAGEGFHFDNEGPRHQVLLPPFRLASRPVNNGEWQAFVEDGGYSTPTLWLSDGWATVQREGWTAPGYWEKRDGAWQSMTLAGLRPVEAEAPVCHVSFYEAEAFARWAGKRLPSETEWEVAAAALPVEGNLGGSDFLRPLPAKPQAGLQQLYGDVWEWTQSPYSPYPGYRPPEGTVGEYNGKFMCNQFVLRGGSCVTPEGHIRATYRNFFYPHQRWQFTGLRLAEDA
ncbi:MAG: ergothioneine biosynthesis protein EgtB [Kiloniellales bacterium]|nr:ergothioneine biosynthesis protein EgtB [Kiloniellales bacterium]